MPGSRPVASILTVWSRSVPVRTCPRRTTRVKVSSVATSQATLTRSPRPEPGVASALGVMRVQSTTAVGSGSPEATPWRNPVVGAASASVVAKGVSVTVATAAVAAAPRTTSRRAGWRGVAVMAATLARLRVAQVTGG